MQYRNKVVTLPLRFFIHSNTEQILEFSKCFSFVQQRSYRTTYELLKF